eukprot:9189248-Pyramimonas_sp.AAC.1
MKVVVDIPEWPPLSVVCLYLKSGTGMCDRNVSYLKAIGRTLEHDKLFVVGGDWNLDPALVEMSGLARRLGSLLF